MSRRRGIRARIACSVAVAVVTGGLSLLAPTSAASASEPALTFSADGSIDSNGMLHETAGACSGFTIPPGVTEVLVRVIGGNGNTGRTVLGHGGGVGGRGADVTVDRVGVKPGQRLYTGSAPGGRPRYAESELRTSPGAGGDGAWVSTYVGAGCTPEKVIAFAGGGGGGGDGDINGPGGTGGNADTRGNDGSGSGTSRAGKGGGPGTGTAGGLGGAGGSVFDITCFCTEHGKAGTAGQSVSLPTTKSQVIGADGRQTGGLGGQELTGGILVQETWGGSGGGGYNGGGGASYGIPAPGALDGSGPQAGAGSGGGGGGSSTPIGVATLSTTRHGEGTNTLSSVIVEARWATTTTVTSSLNPALPGQPVTFTARVATVHPFGARQLAGGTVTFEDIGAAQANGSNGTSLGSAPVVVGPDGRATATLTVPSFTGGDHRTRVRFGGYTPFEDGLPLVLPSTGFVDQVGVAQQTLSFTSTPGSRAAYGEPYTPSVRSTSGLPVTVTVDPSAAAVCGIDPATAPRVSFFSAGTCVLNADQPGSPAYFPAARVQQSFAVATGTPPQQQVITFTSTPPADPVRGSTYDVSAVGGGSGNPVTFAAFSNFGSCSLVAPNQVRFHAGGNCRITASQAAGPGFLAAVATQDLFVKAAAQNIALRSTAPASLAVGSTYTMVVAVDSARLATFSTAPGSTGCTVARVAPTSAGNATSSAIVTATNPGLCVVTAQETTNDIYFTPSPVLTQSIPVGIVQTVAFTSTPEDAVVGASYTPPHHRRRVRSGRHDRLVDPALLQRDQRRRPVPVERGVRPHGRQAGDSTHAPAAQANQSVIVGRASQTIAFTSTAPGDAAVDGTYTPTLQGGTSTASLSLTTTTPSTCLVVGGVVTFTAGGTCTVTADQAGDQNFTAAPQVTQNVMVSKAEDTTAPVVAVPADMTLEATAPDGAVASFEASASDAVDGAVAATCTPGSGTTFVIGATTVSCAATDAAGNTGNASFTVTVEDTTAPVVTVPADMTVEATGPGGATATFNATANDAVDGPTDATCDPASDTTFALGTTEVTCKSTDGAGNTGTASFTVTVEDTTAPDTSLTSAQPDPTKQTGASFTFSGTDIVGVASFECKLDAGSFAACTSPQSYSGLAEGSHTFQVRARDAAGNVDQAPASDTWTIDTTAPVIAVGNVTVDATNPAGATVPFTPTATDVNPGRPVVNCTPASGSTFGVGTTVVYCSATDAAGNTGTASFTVTVKTASTQLTDLQAKVQSLQPDPTTRKNLQSILQNAQTAASKGDTPAACDKLTSFVSQVKALSGKKIATRAADGLLIDARRIIAVLGCS